MHYCKKKRNFRSLSILIFIFSCLQLAFIFILLRYIPLLFSLIEDYVNSGSSFFIPFIPKIKLLSFIPEKNQIIELTLGQLIDIIILVNLICYFESSIYHFFKKKYINEEFQHINYPDLNSLTTGEELYFLSQEQEGLFGLENGLYPLHDDKLFDNKKARSYKIFKLCFNNKKDKKFDFPKIFSFYHAYFNTLGNSHLEKPYPQYIINTTSIPDNQIQRRGKLYEQFL